MATIQSTDHPKHNMTREPSFKIWNYMPSAEAREQFARIPAQSGPVRNEKGENGFAFAALINLPETDQPENWRQGRVIFLCGQHNGEVGCYLIPETDPPTKRFPVFIKIGPTKFIQILPTEPISKGLWTDAMLTNPKGEPICRDLYFQCREPAIVVAVAKEATILCTMLWHRGSHALWVRYLGTMCSLESRGALQPLIL